MVLLLIALFSGFEFAIIYYNRQIFESESKSDGFGIKIISGLLKNSIQYCSSIIIGSIVSISIFCCLAANIIDNYNINIHSSLFILVAIESISTAIIIITFGIFLPMALFQINTKRSLNIIAIPIIIIYSIFYPLTWIIFELSWILSKLTIKTKSLDKKNIKLFGKILSPFIDIQDDGEKGPELEIEHDVKIFQNALDFSKVKLRECAIPRNEIEAVELNSPIEKLKEKFIETGFSKILIYQETIDNIIGFAQSVDIFQSPANISSVIKNVIIVPETMPANKLLNVFLKEHKSIAVVVDEFGGTYGIVTIEDIMEEIFGEIEDEHDSTDLREEKISETEFILSGRLEIDYLNEKYNLGIPESDDYATIAGFILDYNEKIPKEKDKIKIFKFEIEILKLLNPKIELVKLKLLKKA
jgi:CBS domain containing-hemolysin-like protein